MSWQRKIIGRLYRGILKPLAFQADAEMIHDHANWLGEHLENNEQLLSSVFRYSNPKLTKKVLGINFSNPVGLPAGFDYDGHLAQVLKFVGFGFNTVGTVTASPYEGNEKPRLARLPKSKSLLVNKGFKSEGAVAIAGRLDKKSLTNHTIGVSVGSTNTAEINTINKAIDDYLSTFDVFKTKKCVSYWELNISCPNTALTESFASTANFQKLTRAIASLKLRQPIFVKMANEIGAAQSDKLVSIAIRSGIRGFIFSNLVKDRKNSAFDQEEMRRFANKKGNFSGKPTEKNAKSLLSHTRAKFGKEVALVSCGGIFSPTDAIERFQNGADLVQLVTGMIFQGPQLIGEICEELAK